MIKPLRVGIIGVGFIGAQQLEAARRVPGVSVEAVSEPDAARLSDACERLFVPKGYMDFRELIADPAIDVVHNCTPNHLHDEINRAAIHAGKHIYSEKPLSDSAANARELWLLAEARGVAHGVNCQYRLNAAVREMRARVRTGDCGKPLLVRGHYLQGSHARATDYNWRVSDAVGSTRALADIGVHWIDTAMCVMDKPIVSVLADLCTCHSTRTDPETGEAHAIHTDDSATVALRFADGTAGAFTASKVSLGHKNDLEISVDAEGYGMRWAQEDPEKLRIGRRGAPNEILYMSARDIHPDARPYALTPPGHVMGWSDALRNALSAFYASIRDGSFREPMQPYATFRDGWRAVAVIEACLRSSKEGRWVDVED